MVDGDRDRSIASTPLPVHVNYFAALAGPHAKREANPGGYGAFYDRAQATIEAAAEGVVDGLHGPKPAK